MVVRTGEMVLLPRNDPHLLASQTGLPPADPDPLVQRVEGGLIRMVYGGGGEPTHLVCGFVGSEVRRHPLLEALPTAFTLDIKHKPCADWVAASFRFAAQEVASGRAGSETVLAKLSELLFVEAVRHYAEALPPDRKGWLAGLRDPVTVHNFYVPAGADIPDPAVNPKFAHKLDFLLLENGCVIVGIVDVQRIETERIMSGASDLDTP